MKNISFLLIGTFFGIVMTKSEALSWYRIHEMFRFESFHMYGIIGSAVLIGAIGIQLMKRSGMKTLPLRQTRHLLAGSIFGLGWGLIGSCPGPMYVLLGNGYWIAALMILSAILGTFVYGLIKDKLPH